MTPFSSMRPKKSAFVGERLVLKNIFFPAGSAGTNLSTFHLPASNTDVISGSVWPSCDKKAMCM